MLRRLLLALMLTPLLLWSAAALWIDGPAQRVWAGGLAGGVLLLSSLVLARGRPPWRGIAGALVFFVAVLLWWLSLSPSNERTWEPSVARLPRVEFDGDVVTLSNVRNFDYRSEDDFTERWEERRYDLSRVVGMDMFLSYWGSPWIAHTIASWEFDDGRHLAISIETRKEVGESYSAVLGFFRQFELYYVVADERDVVRLRTNYRGEDVYLYRLQVPVENARRLLVSYLEEIEELGTRPRWYNALTHNCTTMIRYHARQVAPQNPWNWRILVNGRLDELGYERGSIDTSLPFEELRRRSHVVSRALAADDAPLFSQRIREGLPGARPPR
jgi:hypothetical protein